MVQVLFLIIGYLEMETPPIFSIQLIYIKVGDYNLCLTYTDANGCSSVYCDTITISSRSSGYTLNVIDESQIATLDIEKMEIISGIKIFPNPTKEDITISTNNFNEKINTEVYDLIGNKLQTTNKTTISLRDYPRGIYILNVAMEIELRK